MADEFPASLQQFAVPKAGDNRAGQKPELATATAAAAKPKPAARKKAAALQTVAQQALQRMQRKTPDIHQAIDQASAGTIKHGSQSPYATGELQPRASDPEIAADQGFDPLESTPVGTPSQRRLDPIALQARRNALLHELGAVDDGLQHQDLSEDQARQAASVEDIPLNLPTKSLAQRARETLDIVRQERGARPQPQPYSMVEGYVNKTPTRIMLEISDGTFTIPVTDVKESRLSVLLLLPLRENATIFIPKPGTQLFLMHGNKTTKVYYPGTYVEVPELQTGFMSLIKADAEAQEDNKP